MERGKIGRLAMRLMLRHRGRMLFFAACIAVGIGFLFAIGNILDTLQASIAGRARQLMAADVILSSARPLGMRTQKALTQLKKERYRVAHTVQFVSMLRPPKGKKGAPQLVSIKAVQQAYPFYGTLQTEPKYTPKAHANQAVCWIAETLQTRLKLKLGDRIRLGTLWLKIVGVIRSEPDQMVSFSGIAPRVLIPFDMAQKTGLMRFGSRIRYSAMLASPLGVKTSAARLANALKKRLEKEIQSPHIRISAYTQAQPTIREAMRRSASFFLLASLVALMLGAIGMATSVTAFLNEQIQTVGVLRSLGLGPKDVERLYFRLCLGMGILGGLGGILFGIALSRGGLHFVGSALGVVLEPQLHFSHWFEGMGIAILLAVGLNISAIRSLSRLSPNAILSGRVHRITLSRWNFVWTALFLLIGLALFTFKGSRSFLVTGFFTASLIGTIVVCLILILISIALVSWFSNRLSGSQPFLFAVRHGLRQFVRQRTRTLTFLLALSIGVSLLSTLRLLEHSLVSEIQSGTSQHVPDLFLVDIQVDQKKKLARLMKRYTQKPSTFSPLIRARLTHINGSMITPKDSKELQAMTMEARSRARFLTREYNLTYKDAISTSETVIKGQFWKPGEEAVQISLERRFAQRVGVDVGDTMTFDIVGRALKGKVTSIRKINWMSMMPNFFVVLPTQVLKKAPQILISSAYFGEKKNVRAFQTKLVDTFPNISAIHLAPIIQRVQTIIRYFVGALRGLAWVCVFVGLLILAGTLTMGRAERKNKVALMRTLGTRRSTLIWIDCVEMLTVGALTACIAIGISWVLGMLFTHFMNIRFHVSWALFAEVGLASLCLPWFIGFLTNRTIYTTGVMENLRQSSQG